MVGFFHGPVSRVVSALVRLSCSCHTYTFCSLRAHNSQPQDDEHYLLSLLFGRAVRVFPAQQTEIIFHFVHSTLRTKNVKQITPPCQSVGGKRYAGWTRSDKTSIFRPGRLHFASTAKLHRHYSAGRHALSNYTDYLGGEQGQKHLITSNDALIA